eukprot:scaffold51208_cov22-Tisochrysis_lutea.AAC.1
MDSNSSQQGQTKVINKDPPQAHGPSTGPQWHRSSSMLYWFVTELPMCAHPGARTLRASVHHSDNASRQDLQGGR